MKTSHPLQDNGALGMLKVDGPENVVYLGKQALAGAPGIRSIAELRAKVAGATGTKCRKKSRNSERTRPVLLIRPQPE